MKKFFVVLFSLLLSLLCLFGCEPKQIEKRSVLYDDTKITILSDVHILDDLQYGDSLSPALSEVLSNNEKAIGLSEALFKAAIDEFIASDSGILILTGDLTDDGAKVAHEEVAAQLARAEQAGKQCFVINGNHDINNRAENYSGTDTYSMDTTSPTTFRSVYADFGYSEALSTDTASLSYTADLNEYYRLIAFDTCHYDLVSGDRKVDGRHLPGCTDSHIEWLRTELEQCRIDGKEPFLITHIPILNHLGPVVGSSVAVNMQSEILDVLQEYEVRFDFCGHIHQQDITSYPFTDYDYYEIETGSLSCSTMPYRVFTGNADSFSVSSLSLSSMKEEYIPSFYTDAEKSAILNNLQQFVAKEVEDCFSYRLQVKTEDLEIMSFFVSSDEDAARLAEPWNAVLDAFFNLPLYGSGFTLESICADYGITLPKVPYETVGRLAFSYLAANFAGNETVSCKDDKFIVTKYALYAAFRLIEDADIFGTISSVNTDISDISFADGLTALFTEGKLELCDNDLLALLGELPALKKLSNNKLLKNLLTDDAVTNADNLRNLLDVLVDNANLFSDATIQTVLTALRLSDGYEQYFDYSEFDTDGKCYLNLNNLLEAFFGDLTVDVTNDSINDSSLTVSFE